MKTYTEFQIRILRAAIYGECTDKNWNYCRENWMKPENIRWLIANQPKIL